VTGFIAVTGILTWGAGILFRQRAALAMRAEDLASGCGSWGLPDAFFTVDDLGRVASAIGQRQLAGSMPGSRAAPGGFCGRLPGLQRASCRLVEGEAQARRRSPPADGAAIE
jgi:hypothetical protein